MTDKNNNIVSQLPPRCSQWHHNVAQIWLDTVHHEVITFTMWILIGISCDRVRKDKASTAAREKWCHSSSHRKQWQWSGWKVGEFLRNLVVFYPSEISIFNLKTLQLWDAIHWICSSSIKHFWLCCSRCIYDRTRNGKRRKCQLNTCFFCRSL